MFCRVVAFGYACKSVLMGFKGAPLKNLCLGSPLILLCLLLTSSDAFAFKLSPITASLDLSKGQSSMKFVVQNPSEELVAIEITMHQRSMNLNGDDELTEDEDSFVVYPSQMILKPNDQRSIKVQWAGASKPKKELAYRLIAEQLPINVNSKKKSGVNVSVLLKYVASVYVDPGKTEPNVMVQDFSVQGGELAITLENSGSKHLVMADAILSLQGLVSGVLQGEQLSSINGQNILADTRRHFSLPLSPNIKPELVKDVVLEFSKR